MVPRHAYCLKCAQGACILSRVRPRDWHVYPAPDTLSSLLFRESYSNPGRKRGCGIASI